MFLFPTSLAPHSPPTHAQPLASIVSYGGVRLTRFCPRPHAGVLAGLALAAAQDAARAAAANARQKEGALALAVQAVSDAQAASDALLAGVYPGNASLARSLLHHWLCLLVCLFVSLSLHPTHIMPSVLLPGC